MDGMTRMNQNLKIVLIMALLDYLYSGRLDEFGKKILIFDRKKKDLNKLFAANYSLKPIRENITKKRE